MDKSSNKQGFYTYRKLSKSQRRAFKLAYKMERQYEAEKRKKAGVKNDEAFIAYLRDTYFTSAEFFLFAFSFKSSPQGLEYWFKIQRAFKEKG